MAKKGASASLAIHPSIKHSIKYDNQTTNIIKGSPELVVELVPSLILVHFTNAVCFDHICFNVFCYNVQPGITIDYATGVSAEETKTPDNTYNPADTPTGTGSGTGTGSCTGTGSGTGTSTTGAQYIINTNTGKFHYPSCSYVGQMSEGNKQVFYGTRDELIAMGYDPCGRCHP